MQIKVINLRPQVLMTYPRASSRLFTAISSLPQNGRIVGVVKFAQVN